MKYQNDYKFKITSISLTILFLGLMSASITHAENYLFVNNIGSLGINEGQLHGPYDVAVDSFGNVYVADTSNNRIDKFDSSGKFVTNWDSPDGTSAGKFKNPQGITVDSQGNVYLADTGNNCIQKFDRDGKFITKWGSHFNSSGQLSSPQDVAVDSLGNVYVADCNNNCIQKFDSNGKFITEWGSQGSEDAQLHSPYGVAVDLSGNVYVVNPIYDRIQKFDSNGKYITKWGSQGNSDRQFIAPKGIAIDLSDNVYVADSTNHRIQKFDSSGNYLFQWGSYGTGEGQFKYPQGVAVDSSGNVYVADWGNDRIQKFAFAQSPEPTPTEQTQPTTIAVTNMSSGEPDNSPTFASTVNNGDSLLHQNPLILLFVLVIIFCVVVIIIGNKMKKKIKYDVALSYASEERAYVEKVAKLLEEKGKKVFYDKSEEEEVNSWGKDLSKHLYTIYAKEARYCIMFLSKNYAKKMWTNHEKRSALERAFKEKSEYILPVRCDDTEIDEIPSTIGFIDARQKTPEQLVDMILKKMDPI